MTLWGRSSVPIIIKLVLELGVLFVCLQNDWFLLRVVDASYSLGIFANGAYEADTAQDHYYYVGIDTAYWTGHSP